MRGIEPPTSRSQSERSTDELHPDTRALRALTFEHLLAWVYEIYQVYTKDTAPDYIRNVVKE